MQNIKNIIEEEGIKFQDNESFTLDYSYEERNLRLGIDFLRNFSEITWADSPNNMLRI